jgi:hypothetical protein
MPCVIRLRSGTDFLKEERPGSETLGISLASTSIAQNNDRDVGNKPDVARMEVVCFRICLFIHYAS